MKPRLLISFLCLCLPLEAIDSDGDGLDDAVETNTGMFVSLLDTGTDPNNPDTDGDGVLDGLENPILDRLNLDVFGCNFVHLNSVQAGSFTDIQSISIRDLDADVVVFSDDFSSSNPTDWAFRHIADYLIGQPVILDSPLGRIESGMLRLECIGFGQNGAGGYNSLTGANPNCRLPENFEMTFEARRNQWPGHLRIEFLPSLQYFYDSQPEVWAGQVGWAGTRFPYIRKFFAATDTLASAAGDEGSLSVNAWHTISIRKLNGVISVFADGSLRRTENLEVFNYSLLELTQDETTWDSDGDGLTDSEELELTLTNPDLPDTDGNGIPDGEEDPDGDGLSNLVEVRVHGTNPRLSDTDGDGFDDPFEISIGFDPTSAQSTPEGLSRIRTAIEFEFYAANGASYRIEGSSDLQNWTNIETGIPGNGGVISRVYSIRGQPNRYFRAERE